ncbi:MAG TPA: lamin tail domain-containing protein, partial [Flavisolibacter sp.]|nr:lamin tail domain-containing protein [Flavisolibacter sp.]
MYILVRYTPSLLENCFFVRFVCFIAFIVGANVIHKFFTSKYAIGFGNLFTYFRPMTNAKWFILALSQLFALYTGAQVSEDFSDGNFTANPVWTGTANSWIVNTSGQLQSNNTVANSTFYLSTAGTMAVNAQWEFYVQLSFNTSSLNYADVYLIASASDLTSATTTGYFVRIGNTQDDICLYRKDAGGKLTRIIDGVDGITNSSNNSIRIKVIRDADNRFSLYRDLTGIGNNYVAEGSATDFTYTSSAFFGLFIQQSTASFFQKHYFDDIDVQPYTADVTPPTLYSVKTVSNSGLDLLFSEPLNASRTQTPSLFIVDHNIGGPGSVVVDASNPALLHLNFDHSFESGISYSLTIDGVSDISGNVLHNYTTSFFYGANKTYELIIDEIMTDPSPVVGLPNAEYIEIKNASGHLVNLAGYRLQTDNAISGAFPDYDLPAGDYLILCSNSNVSAFSVYGNTLGI